MKTKILYRLWVVLAFTCIVYSCKKSDSNSDTGQSNTDLQTQSDDQTQVTSENSAVLDDVTTVVTDKGGVTGASAPRAIRYGVTVETVPDTIPYTFCDGTVSVDTANGDRKITITYNGSTCNPFHTRTGTVVISWPQGQQWINPGSVLTITIQNLKITRTRDGKSITLNGTHTYTNVTGGNIAALAYNEKDTIVHTITSSNMTVTFNNNTTRSWSVARQRMFTYSNGLVMQETGTHTDGSTAGISEWGTNRWGNSFETVITSPLTIAQSCQFQLTSGQVKIIQPKVTTTTTFGLDSGGNPIGCSDTGYYFKVVVTGVDGKSYTFILPY